MRRPARARTVMACAILAERAVSALVLINKTALAVQWREQIRNLLGIKAGQLGGGRTKTRGQVDTIFSCRPDLVPRPSHPGCGKGATPL